MGNCQLSYLSWSMRGGRTSMISWRVKFKYLMRVGLDTWEIRQNELILSCGFFNQWNVRRKTERPHHFGRYWTWRTRKKRRWRATDGPPNKDWNSLSEGHLTNCKAVIAASWHQRDVCLTTIKEETTFTMTDLIVPHAHDKQKQQKTVLIKLIILVAFLSLITLFTRVMDDVWDFTL